MYKFSQIVRVQETVAVIIVLIYSVTIITNVCISWTTPPGSFPYALPNTKPLSWRVLTFSHSTGKFLPHNLKLSSRASSSISSFLTLLNLHPTIKNKNKTSLICVSTNFSAYFNNNICETFSHLLFIYSAWSFKLSSLNSVILVSTIVLGTPLMAVDKINKWKNG